jgi:hypothetical protein
MNKNLLRNLYEIPEFRMLLEELKKSRPIIPQYDWAKENIEEIKAKSCIQQGYDMAISIFHLNGE